MSSLDKNNDVWTHHCPVFGCDAFFFTRPEYKEHMETNHKGTSDLRVRKCGFTKCKRVFLTKEDYQDHMRRIHGVLVPKPIVAASFSSS